MSISAVNALIFLTSCLFPVVEVASTVIVSPAELDGDKFTLLSAGLKSVSP